MIRIGSQNRKYFMHAAHRSVGVSRLTSRPTFPQLLRTTSSIEVFATAEEQAICRQFLERMAAFYPDADWLLQSRVDRGLEVKYPLEESDCVVLLAGREPFSSALLEQLEHYANQGGAIVALNVGQHSSPAWKKFAGDILGVNFEASLQSSKKLSLRIAAGRHFHPVVEGVTAWGIENNCVPRISDQAELFLEGIGEGIKLPLVWGVHASGNRAFCTLLGTPHDFQQPSFFRLIGNALAWTMDSEKF